jgi:hypothetical protein
MSLLDVVRFFAWGDLSTPLNEREEQSMDGLTRKKGDGSTERHSRIYSVACPGRSGNRTLHRLFSVTLAGGASLGILWERSQSRITVEPGESGGDCPSEPCAVTPLRCRSGNFGAVKRRRETSRWGLAPGPSSPKRAMRIARSGDAGPQRYILYVIKENLLDTLISSY